MAVEQAIYSILSTDAAVIALVATRIHPGQLCQADTMPAIAYTQTAGPRDQVMDGPTGLVDSTFEIDCFAATYSDSRDLADAVRVALDGYADTAAGTEIQASMMINELDQPAIKAGTDVLTRYVKKLIFNIWFKE